MFTNWLTSSATTSSNSTVSYTSLNVSNSQSPDVLIDVGPPPYSRFAAHSSLISMHSGYIRAALIRDPNNSTPYENSIYIPNVTVDQFTPLFTYMYTGFLDLNIENIFGVLLATHLLHMPRALEICRAFLNRQQSEEYLSGYHQLQSSNVIRPIPSKAITDHVSFISPPMSHNIILPSRETNFKKINNDVRGKPSVSITVVPQSPPSHRSIPIKPILPESSLEQSNKILNTENTTQNIPLKKLSNLSNLNKSRNSPQKSPSTSKTPPIDSIEISSVSPACIESSENSSSKIIIDVACCDGPVRFHRVLNDAYGQLNLSNNSTPSFTPINDKHQSSNLNSITTAFHQQMAKHINERNNFSIEESENSQDTNPHNKDNIGATNSSELYICVYCKHTFKSQYCYQKHAKRHINPLNIDSGSGCETSSIIELLDDKSSSYVLKKYEKTASSSNSINVQHVPQAIKREVRPLDMNVQYYPCKTCGCKFPSYYFVHKHRKLCHADEDN